MSSRSSSERRRYALRSDQTFSAQRRVEWSQVHTDKIVASVRELYMKWQEVCGAGAHTFVMQEHSSNVQRAIAEIMIQNQWTPSVEQAVRDILGASAPFNVAMGQLLAERHSVGSPLETKPAPAEGEISPTPQGSECV